MAEKIETKMFQNFILLTYTRVRRAFGRVSASKHLVDQIRNSRVEIEASIHQTCRADQS